MYRPTALQREWDQSPTTRHLHAALIWKYGAQALIHTIMNSKVDAIDYYCITCNPLATVTEDGTVSVYMWSVD